MTELKDIIILAQNLNKEAMYDIITKFNPLIEKYARKIQNYEDFKSELILHLIETVYNIDLKKFRIPNDYAIINYISNTLYHKYIILSKKQVSIRKTENLFNKEDIEECVGIDNSTTREIDHIFLKTIMKKALTKREYDCTTLIVIDGLSSREVANILGISRQSANENKNRGLKKLKKIFESHNE